MKILGIARETAGLQLGRTVPGSYPYTVLSRDYYVAVTDTSAARVINLPAANSVTAGHTFEICDESGASSSHSITITPNGTDTIEGAATFVISKNNQSIRIYSNGTSNWILDKAVRGILDLGEYSSTTGTGTAAIRSTITSATTNDVLTWNGSNWINQALPTSSAGAAGSTGQIQYNSAGALAASSSLTYSSNSMGVGGAIASNANLTLQSQGTSQNGMAILGTGYFQGSSSTDGVWFGLNSNLSTNLQLFIGQYSKIGSSTDAFFRLVFLSGSNPTIDAISGDGSARKDMSFGNDTTNVSFGMAPGTTIPTSAKTIIQLESTKTFVVRADTAVSQSANVQEWRDGSNATISCIDKTAAMLGLGTTTPNTWSSLSPVTGSNLQIASAGASRLVVNANSAGAEFHLVCGGNAANDRNWRLFTSGTNLVLDQPSDDYSSTVQLIKMTPTGSVIFGPGSALSTSATNGFLYIPTCGGTPTGTPTTQSGTVAQVYDTTNDKLYVYDGSWISVSGSSNPTISSISSTTTLTNQDYVLATGTITLTLPSAATAAKPISIKNIGTGSITIAPAGGQLIDSASTQVISTKFASLTLVPDGSTNWYIM